MDSLLAKDNNNNNGLFKQVLEPLFDIFLFFGACIVLIKTMDQPQKTFGVSLASQSLESCLTSNKFNQTISLVTNMIFW